MVCTKARSQTFLGLGPLQIKKGLGPLLCESESLRRTVEKGAEEARSIGIPGCPRERDARQRDLVDEI